MAEKKSSASGRTRNFTAVVYPDSVNTPENWIDVLREEHIPAIISPLHDKDLTAVGDPKKAHYHVILCFDSLKTPEQAREVFALIGAVCPPSDRQFKVAVLRTLARYMCHLDDPNKAQYDVSDVVCIGGIDYFEIIGSASDRYAAIGEMIDYCYENSVVSYAALLMYARTNRSDWFRVLCDSGTVVMREFLKSLQWTNKQQEGGQNVGGVC